MSCARPGMRSSGFRSSWPDSSALPSDDWRVTLEPAGLTLGRVTVVRETFMLNPQEVIE